MKMSAMNDQNTDTANTLKTESHTKKAMAVKSSATPPVSSAQKAAMLRIKKP